ncbi:unnamed protein product, partial [Mycena citricolor]
ALCRSSPSNVLLPVIMQHRRNNCIDQIRIEVSNSSACFPVPSHPRMPKKRQRILSHRNLGGGPFAVPMSRSPEKRLSAYES